MTLFEQVTNWMYKQQYKHELGEDYVENTINNMTDFEFLQVLSEEDICIT